LQITITIEVHDKTGKLNRMFCYASVQNLVVAAFQNTTLNVKAGGISDKLLK
jgi:hypothetical protein